MSQDTHVVAPASGLPPDEFGRLAQLAFASRTGSAHDSHAARQLAFVSPDVLDMDLSDPMQRDFGDYELLEKIGQGGMGMVYRARQHSLERDVALKLLAAGPWASREFIERFRREAQSAARLEHPNIVTIYEAGTQHDLHYFSMRLVRGESLASRLQREGRLAPREAARLLLIVAEAVDYAHRLGVLHLDLKPGNVLIDEAGDPLVADFGLARRIDEALAHEGEDVSGTPAYMAPEQATARSQQIGRSTDIYGLGAILYELLCGRPPFLGPTPQATLERVVNEAVTAPRRHERSIPPDLEAICLKCLAKEPAHRYATAADLRDDLRRFLEDRPVSVRLPPPLERARRWVRREPRVTAAIAASVAALLIGLLASTSQWRRAEANAATSRQRLWEGRREAALRLEEDGKGYAALPQLIANLREAESAGAREEVARDQRRIGLMLGQGATLIDRIAIDDANPFALELSPRGERLAIAFNDLSVRWYDTDQLRELGRVSLAGRGSSSGADRLPALLRFVDERRLLLTLSWYTNLPSPSDSDSWLIDLDAARVIEPPEDFGDFSDATYSRDGRHALLRNRAGQMQWWQLDPWRALSPRGPPTSERQPWVALPEVGLAMQFAMRQESLQLHRLPDLGPEGSVRTPHGSGLSAWALSHDGRSLALGDFDGRIFLLDLATRALRPVPHARGREVVWLSFSEDDGLVAAATFGGVVSVFDAANGDPVHADLMRHDFRPRRLGLSAAQRLLIVAGEGEVALWRLARPGERAAAPHRIGTVPAPHGLAAPYAIGWSMQNGLMATAGIDGQVRLWRLPLSPTLPARSARQRGDRLDFDGHRLVDVEGRHLRLVDASGRGQGAWRSYRQSPGFATLLDARDRLLLTLGPSLQLEDAVTGRALAPPLALGNTPQRLLASPGGQRVLLAFGARGEQGFEEHLRLVDAASGTFLPGEARVRGPVRRYAFSADGASLLAVGPGEAATTVLDGHDLSRVAEYSHDPYEPVQWADFMPDGTVLLATRASDARLGQDTLRRWDPSKDELCGEAILPQLQPLGTLALDASRAFVAGARRDGGVDAAGALQPVARRAPSEPSAALALDPTGRLLARGHRHHVQLFDAQRLEPMGRPLSVDLNALDTLVQLSFSPDGRQLVGNSWLGHWVRWLVAPDPRDAAALDAHVAPLATEKEDQQLMIAPTPAERAALRAADPGPWPAPEARPETMPVRYARAGEGVPPRATELPARLVDLTQNYDMGPRAVRNFYYNVMPSLNHLPIGPQRLGGVDYDLRGLVSVVIWPPGTPGRTRVDGLACAALGGQTAPGLHLLLDVSLPEPVATGTVLARATLRYEDGTVAVLPLRAGHELPGYRGEDAAVPTVFSANPLMAWTGLEDHALSAPHLQNPHPRRPLSCLGLMPADPVWPLALLAVTLDPPAP